MRQTIRELRQGRGWTQAELARRVGVSRRTVASWERGLAQPPAARLQQLAQVFGVLEDDLLSAPSWASRWYLDPIDYGRGQVLLCPVAGCTGAKENQHICGVAVNRGGRVTVIAGEDPPREYRGSPTDQGSSVWIEFRGECGHLWALHFQFSQGVVLYAYEERGWAECPPPSGYEFWRD